MSASSFDEALTLVLDLEGGFVNDPRDPGGATNLGITGKTLAAARGRPVSVADLRALTRAEAGAIYRRLYWDAVGADQLPPGLDLAVFDYAVNSGVGRSARSLQAALGVRQDGLIGPETIAVARARDCAKAVSALTAQRLAYLRGLSTWPAFGRGWTARVNRVESAALAAAGRAADTPARSVSPPVDKDDTMNLTKSVLASRTVWANVIGLASLGLGLFGVKTGSIDANGLADAASQVVTGASFIASTVFRVTAKKQIASNAT